MSDKLQDARGGREGGRGSGEVARRHRVRGEKTTQGRRTRGFGCLKEGRSETLECKTQVTAERERAA